MKKFLVLLIITTMLLSSALGFAEPSPWALNEIERARAENLVPEDLLSNYQDNITREEFCEITVKLYESISSEVIKLESKNPFTDTSNPEVIKAYNLGIVSGIGEGKFAPNNTITREEIAVMFFRTIKLLNPKLESNNFKLGFNDGDFISSWAKEAVSYMGNKKIINGIGNNNFGPKGTATREQAMALTLRIFTFYNTDLKLIEEKVVIKEEKDKEKLSSVAIGKLSDSLVLIYVETINGEFVTGSGFFYEKGKLATNYHVIENAVDIVLEYEDGSFYSDKVIITGYSQEYDLATLSIKDTTTKALPLGDSDIIEKGENIYVIGSPRGLKNSLTNGIISGIRSTDIQISAGINPGNSGGALLNEYGQVIGVIYAKYEESENLGFAIPINLLKTLDKKLNLSIKEFFAETSVTPQAPTNVKAVYNGEDGFYISWDNVGADYYVAYVSSNGADYFELIDGDGNNMWYWDYDYSINNYGYIPGDIVEYAVVSVIDGNYSEWSYSMPVSMPITPKTPKTPKAPTNVKAIYDGGDGFNISWDNVGADYYVVYVSQNGSEYIELLDSYGYNMWNWEYGYSINNYGYNPGDTVEYAVAAVIDGNYSDYSYSKPAKYWR